MAEYKYAIGIDLGTTNTLAFYLEGGRMKPVKFKGNQMMPSVLYVDKTGKLYVGQQAANRGALDSKNMIRSSKKYIGDNEIKKTWSLNGKVFTPTDVAMEILKEVRRRFIQQIGCDENEKIGAVITVPAYFNNNRVNETRKAGIAAGFDVLSIEPEPMMAAIAAARKDMPGDGRKVFVVDIGGGTFDLSVLSANEAEHVYEAIALDGDPNLGGDDFDAALTDKFVDLIKDQAGIDLSGAVVSGLEEVDYEKLMSLLRDAAREAKVALSAEEETDIDLPDLLPDFDFHVKFDRDDFDTICQDIYDKIFNRTEKFIRENKKFHPNEIGKLVLAGGSCYIPYIRQRMAQMFPNIVDDAEAERSMLVAKGAAHMAAAKMHGVEGGGITVRSIVAHSLGIMVLDKKSGEKVLSKILLKGTNYPCQNSVAVTTTVDNQTEIPILVYEAGNDDEDKPGISYHKLYGSIVLKGINKMRAGEPNIDVTFAYNDNQILTVTATDCATGNQKVEELKAGEKVELPDASPIDLVLLLDKSGSMRGTELVEAKQASHKLVNEMIDFSVHRMSVIAFGDKAEICSNLTNNRNGELQIAIDGIEAYGGTNMIAAFEAAANILTNSGSRERIAVMVTDGYPNTRERTINYAQKLMVQGIRIIAIGVGTGVDLAFLRQMVGKKNAYRLDNMHELAETFRQVMQMITRR